MREEGREAGVPSEMEKGSAVGVAGEGVGGSEC